MVQPVGKSTGFGCAFTTTCTDRLGPPAERANLHRDQALDAMVQLVVSACISSVVVVANRSTAGRYSPPRAAILDR